MASPRKPTKETKRETRPSRPKKSSASVDSSTVEKKTRSTGKAKRTTPPPKPKKPTNSKRTTGKTNKVDKNEQILRDTEMVRLRFEERWSYDDIAKEMGFFAPGRDSEGKPMTDADGEPVMVPNRSVVWKAIKRTLEKVQEPTVENIRTIELDKLDQIEEAHFEDALVRGNYQGVDRILKVMGERRRLVPQLEIVGDGDDEKRPISIVFTMPTPSAGKPVAEADLAKPEAVSRRGRPT